MSFRCAECGGYTPIALRKHPKRQTTVSTYDNRLTNLRGMKCDECMHWFPSGTLIRESRHAVRWWQLEKGTIGTLEYDSDGEAGIFTD